MNNFLYSYTDFIRERNFFKMVDDKGINRYDSPSALYYKIVFYFTDDNGLLGVYNLSDDVDNDISNIKSMTAAFNRKNRNDEDPEPPNSAKKINYRNTAYNYLLVNDEIERAEMLKRFIILLSDINSGSPWYFQEISGLDSALERKIFSDGEVKLEDKPRQITIKCLQDAYDNRIGTLLDLYRAACFSYQNKKEIIPANLRKFNMGILVFNAPIRGKGGKSGDKNNYIMIPDSDINFYVPSAKLIELRNCEFDYNSTKSAWGTLNTTDNPFSPEYTITINYDDAYESRYNEIMEGVVTDFINYDLNGDKRGIYINNTGTINGNMDLDPLKFKFDSEKEGINYWLNTDISKINSGDSKNPDTSKIYIGETDKREEKSIDDIGTAFGEKVFTTQTNSLKDKTDSSIQSPSISKNNNIDENIHDNGTVNKLGEFEYLNRLGAMGGFIGNVMQQAVGISTSALKDKVSQMYIGNIHSLSVSNMLDMGNKFLSGNIAGGISSAKKYNNPQIGDKSMIGNKLPEYNGKDNPPQINISSGTIGELPGYIKGRTKFLNKMNTKQSIRNNI